MLLPSLRFAKPLLLSIALPLTLLTPTAVPLTRAQENSIEIAPTNVQRDEEADRLLLQGIDQFKADQYEAALQPLQAALERFRQNGDRYGEANALFSLGLVYDYMGQSQQAIEHYQQALPLYRAMSSLGGEALDREAAALNNLGIVYASINQPQQAIEHYQQALPLYRAVGNRNREITSLALIAEALTAQNQTDLAIDYFRQSIEVFVSLRAELIAAELTEQGIYIPSYYEFLAEPYRRYADLLMQQNRPQEAQRVLDLVREVKSPGNEDVFRGAE